MRAISAAAAALTFALVLSCGGDDKALRDATEEDLPRLVLQQEDVPDGSQQGTESCGQTAAFELGGSTEGFRAEYDLSSIEAQQIGCLSSTVGLYQSGEEALSYLKGHEAIYLEDEQPAQAPPDIVAEKINVPKLGEYASGFVIKCAECSEPSHWYSIQIQQRNVRSLVVVNGRSDEDAVEQAIDYAEKQKERIETVLGQAQ